MEQRWKVEFHGEFATEFVRFSDPVRQQVFSLSALLETFGPRLSRPHVDTLKGSRRRNMKELRFYADGGVWRVAFAFDSKRQAILLVAGDKSGISKDRFYRSLIQIAERRFDQHQRSLKARE